MESLKMSQNEFLKQNNIPHCLIWYFIHKDTKKKIPIGEMSNAKKDDIKTTIKSNQKPLRFYDRHNQQLRDLTTEESNTLTLANSLYLKHSDDNIFCADFDDETINSIDDLIKVNDNFKIFKDCSYLNGNTKGIHIYLIIDNVPEYSSEIDVFNYVKGDLIRRKNNMWEKQSKPINGSSKLLRFNYDDVKHLFNNYFINGRTGKKKTIKRIVEVVDKKGKKTKKEVIEEVKYKEYEHFEVSEQDRNFISLLKPDRFYRRNDWCMVLKAFKSVGLEFELFHEFSKKHGKEKYVSEEDCRKHWTDAKVAKINFGLIHYWAKTDSPIQYEDLLYSYIEGEKEFETVKISQRYLLRENRISINDTSDKLENEIIKFTKDKAIKTFNLKSPYDTGKTQLIKRYIDTFNPKRILWLSYRKTLSNDILSNFEEKYDFKDYQKREFDADRLIIQVESILKISNPVVWCDEISEYPSYDLVIIDEIESILKQFSSPTFNGNSKECFNFIQNTIINSTKLICMDGDISNRTYEFCSTFGQMVNIENDIKINKRIFNISFDREAFYTTIKKSLSEDKNIAIVSMSATACQTFNDKIKIDFPKKIVKVYTGNSDDKKKEDFKDVVNVWKEANVLIYSPTVESGVNFDIKHFDSVYGILSESTTSRQFLQMLARIRKLENNNIMILNETFTTKASLNKFFTFEEVKQSVITLENIKLTSEDVCINGKMCKKNTILTAYDTNYIYNKLEELNNGKYYFLSMFEKLCKSKGHEVNYLSDKPKKITKDANKITNTQIINSTEDISDDKFIDLLEKQKKDNAEEKEKYQIKKHTLKMALGLDFLTEDVIKTFEKSSIKNFTSLIDENNIKNCDDNQTKEFKDKAKLINGLLKDLGYSHIFDTTLVKNDVFVENMNKAMKNNKIFTDMKNTRVRFGLNKSIELVSNKQFLGFVNSLFKNYHFKLSYTKVRVKGTDEREKAYKIEILNDINELLEYRIIKGYDLSDPNNIRTKPTTETYKSLVNWELVEEKKKEKEEDKKREYLFGK